MHAGHTWILLATLAVLGLGACTPQREGSSAAANVASPSEPSFAEQAAAVRAGTSDQIRLNETPVSDADLLQLDGLADDLLRINLSRTTISDAGMAKIAGMHKLVQLRLAAPNVTDAGLASVTQLKELKHLHLIAVPLTDAGLEPLAALKHLSSLYLDDTQVTSEGMRRLVEALPNVHLHFDGGHIRDDPQAGHEAH